MFVLTDTMEHAHNVQQYREHYKYFKANPKDKAFAMEYKSQLILFEQSLKELKKSYDKMPNTKEILIKLDQLNEKKNTLMQEYSNSKSHMDELYRLRKNYGIYMNKEIDR